jgi:hypothetical protein
MSSILDPIQDKNLTVFHRLVNLYEIPDFVKSASIKTIDEEETKSLPAAAFADPAYRQFPCHTKAATYLSYAYFVNGANRLTKLANDSIGTRLQSFIDHWGIRWECDNLKKEMDKQANAAKQELPDDCFAMVETYDNNVVRRLPIVNAENVKTAAEYLFNNRDKYPYQWRKRASRKILKKAAEFNTALPSVCSEYINKCAGYGLSSQTKIALALRDRIALIQADDKLRLSGIPERIIKVAKEIVTAKNLSSELMNKTAEFISTVDNITGFYKLYTRGLPTPEEIVFELTEKRASSIKNTFVQLTTGSAFRRADIEKAAFAPFKLLGDDLVEEVTDALGSFDLEKAATLLATLPRNDASIYEKGMRLLNIPTERQIRKQAGISDNVSEWSKADWETYIDSIGETAAQDFSVAVRFKHPQSVN